MAETLGQDGQEVMPPGDVGWAHGMALRRGHREGYDAPEGAECRARGC